LSDIQFQNDTESPDFAGKSRSVLYDPALPILHFPGGTLATSRRNQRIRRARILAIIRRLLTEEGFDSVTMRRVAQESGHAVQTVYNLVGPRDQAIVEAISEYTRFVGRTAMPRAEDPHAIIEIIDRWLQSIEAAPEFCRQVSLIFFSRSRRIFYDFRDKELKGMLGMLRRQQKVGALRPEVNVQDLADQLMMFASGLCIEWADRPFSVEKMRRRLFSGYANILAVAVTRSSLSRRMALEADEAFRQSV